jgi:hypothetical protein
MMMKNRYINRGTKTQIYKTLIRPVVTYGCESWTMKKKKIKIFYEDLRGKLSVEFTAQ